jgi:phenylacetic acid degradation operon negative regulatory protein
MRNFRKPRIGPVGEAILASIALVGVVSVFALFPGLTYALAPFIKRKKQPRSQNIQKSLDALVRAGLVKRTIRKNGEVTVELTKKGKWEALLRAPSLDTKCAEWDGLWRVVIFDVPQSKNKIRRELRHAMKLYGFRMLQQSVWVYPHPCDDFVGLLKKHLGVSNDVLYMKVAFIENDKHLRKEFDV